MIPRAMPAVVQLLAGSPLLDRSRVMAQTKRVALASRLVFGGGSKDPVPCNQPNVMESEGKINQADLLEQIR